VCDSDKLLFIVFSLSLVLLFLRRVMQFMVPWDGFIKRRVIESVFLSIGMSFKRMCIAYATYRIVSKYSIYEQKPSMTQQNQDA
jgi:hypothetical protein